jgi:hypothetical protein
MSAGLTRLIRPLALMTLLKNLGRHSDEIDVELSRRNIACKLGKLIATFRSKELLNTYFGTLAVIV